MISSDCERVSIESLPPWAKKLVTDAEKARSAAFHYREIGIAWNLAVYEALKSHSELLIMDKIIAFERIIRKEAEAWLSPAEKEERLALSRQAVEDMETLRRRIEERLAKKASRYEITNEEGEGK